MTCTVTKISPRMVLTLLFWSARKWHRIFPAKENNFEKFICIHGMYEVFNGNMPFGMLKSFLLASLTIEVSKAADAKVSGRS